MPAMDEPITPDIGPAASAPVHPEEIQSERRPPHRQEHIPASHDADDAGRTSSRRNYMVSGIILAVATLVWAVRRPSH
jgi:hypothetical protein